MAKKSSNPADAYRKALKAKESKKNKEARKSARETQVVKRDTREIESEIKRLKSQGKSNDEAKSRLESLQSESKYVQKTKEAYVKAHPEAHDRVFKQHRDRERGEDDEAGPSDPNGSYGEDGKSRDPTRSVYYDPVYNPYGVPPPGMPYKERTPIESESEDESDDEIIMPEGPPPGGDSDSDSDDSDDIPLPEGPPPSAARPPPSPSGSPPNVPTGPSTGFVRPPFQPQPPAPWGWGEEIPYTPQPGTGPSGPRPPRPPHRPNTQARPPPVVQDPLSDAPTQTYQGHRMQHALPARPTSGSTSIDSASTSTSNPAEPAKPPQSSKPIDYSAAAISAAPVMRDSRKEATAFVPRGVKRKQAAAPGGVNVNAAPGRGEVDEDGDERRVVEKEEGGGLMGRLKGVLGDEMGPKKAKTGPDGDDEYQKFSAGSGESQ